jgi:hypothetical protein
MKVCTFEVLTGTPVGFRVMAPCRQVLAVWLKEHSASVHRFVRFEVLTAVTMKNVIFWDIKTQFVSHRRHITSLFQNPVG